MYNICVWPFLIEQSFVFGFMLNYLVRYLLKLKFYRRKLIINKTYNNALF